jgi:hypothetical protein
MPSFPTKTNVPATAPEPGNRSPVSISPVAWVPNREIEFPEWAEAGRRLGAMGRCGQWGLGDWIKYGNSKFGQRYTRAARITGYDVQTLMNMVYVASKFEISRRRENLSWSHHETVASLEADEQDRWLDLATSQSLSVADLRVELRSSRRAVKSTAPGKDGQSVTADGGARETAPDGIELLICPNCGGKVPLPSRVASLSAGT